jgi:hypothetical protein
MPPALVSLLMLAAQLAQAASYIATAIHTGDGPHGERFAAADDAAAKYMDTVRAAVVAGVPVPPFRDDQGQ